MARKSKEESKKYSEYYKKNFPSWTLEECENAVKKFKRYATIEFIMYGKWIIKKIHHLN